MRVTLSPGEYLHVKYEDMYGKPIGEVQIVFAEDATRVYAGEELIHEDKFVDEKRWHFDVKKTSRRPKDIDPDDIW